MNWIIFLAAFVAPFSFALVNHIDGFLVKKVSTPGALTIFSSLFGFITAAILGIVAYALGDSLMVSGQTLGLLLVSGFLQIIWLIAYLKAMEADDVAAVVPWFQIIPFFVWIFSYLILGEILTRYQLIGSAFLILGGVLLSIDFEKFKIKKRVALLMILASGTQALGIVMFKFAALPEPSFVTSLFWIQIGFGLTGVLLIAAIATYRAKFVELMRTQGRAVLSWSALNEILNAVGTLALLRAGLVMSITFVSVLESFQPLYVVILGFLLPFVSGRFQKPITGFWVLVPQIAAIVCMVIGAVIGFDLASEWFVR